MKRKKIQDLYVTCISTDIYSLSQTCICKFTFVTHPHMYALMAFIDLCANLNVY